MRKICRSVVSVIALTLSSSLFLTCHKDGDNPVSPSSGNIQLGPSSTVFTGSVSPSAGITIVHKAGDSLDGLMIDVPAGAFTATQELTIASASIQSHKFGADVQPITPFIAINPGSAYAQRPVSITIPVRVPANSFGIPMAYNPRTDKLEVLPIIGLTDTSITTYLADFAPGSPTSSTLSRLGLSKPDISFADLLGLFIIAASSAALDLTANYPSGFLPGVNDWQFTNFGSTWAPGGHCDGQSVTMMWYFNNRSSKGSQSLFGLYDNDANSPATPSLQWDDVLGYRLCSVVQHDFNSGNIITELAALQQKTPIGDIVTMKLFSYALGHGYGPQLVGLGGYNSNGVWEGHTVLAYQQAGNELCVADPNYPGVLTRRIQYTHPIFQPYLSGLNANSPGTRYTKIYFVRYQSAFFNWNSVADRWKEFESKTVGNGSFPNYIIKVLDDSANYVPLTDGFTSTGNELALRIQSTADLKFTAFSEACAPIPVTSNSISLPNGKQRVGICLWDQQNYWAGFNWYSVEMGRTSSDSSTIFPLATGNTWTYTESKYYSNGQSYATTTYTVSIVDAKFAGTDLWFACTDTRGEDTTWITRRFDGIWVYPMGTSYPQFMLLQYPADAGDSFASGPDGLTQVTVQGTTYTRVVPAGSFSPCYGYKRVTIGRTDYFMQYFSPGIGSVEEMTYSQKTGGGEYMSVRSQLQSYHINR
jgi:hypothetical protein